MTAGRIPQRTQKQLVDSLMEMINAPSDSDVPFAEAALKRLMDIYNAGYGACLLDNDLTPYKGSECGVKGE